MQCFQWTCAVWTLIGNFPTCYIYLIFQPQEIAVTAGEGGRAGVWPEAGTPEAGKLVANLKGEQLGRSLSNVSGPGTAVLPSFLIRGVVLLTYNSHTCRAAQASTGHWDGSLFKEAAWNGISERNRLGPMLSCNWLTLPFLQLLVCFPSKLSVLSRFRVHLHRDRKYSWNVFF